MSVELSEKAKNMLARLGEENIVYSDFDMPEGDDAEALTELEQAGFCEWHDDGREEEYRVYNITEEGRAYLAG